MLQKSYYPFFQIKSKSIKSNQSSQINQIKSIKSNQILYQSNQIKSIKSIQINQFNQIKSSQIKSSQIKSNQIKSIKSNQIKSIQFKSIRDSVWYKLRTGQDQGRERNDRTGPMSVRFGQVKIAIRSGPLRHLNKSNHINQFNSNK